MTRKFIIDGREHPDIDPGLSVDEIRMHYAQFYPELNNADTTSAKSGGDDIITFAKRVGTKG